MSVLVLRAQLAGASALGLSLDDVASASGIAREALRPELLADPDARVPARWVLALWETLPARAPDRPFGIWLAELTSGAPLTVAWWVVHTSPTLAEGLARAVRFQRLMHDRFRSELVTSGDEGVLRHRVGDGAFVAPPVAIDFGFAALVHLARRATGRGVVPSRVELTRAEPRDPAPYRAVFGPRVAFGRPANELAFDRATLSLPSSGHDPALREVIESHARSMLEKLPPDAAPFAARVRAVIVERMRGRQTSLDDVAERLGLPRRTLQRKLREEGTRFEELLDRVRRDLAERYLADGRVSVQETAFLLGFSDVSAFHRAFVRWTGTTPARFRAERTRAGT